MSKKTCAVEHTGPTENFPFDNYEQFEKAMDDIIIQLNTQLSANRTHDDELDIIEHYLSVSTTPLAVDYGVGWFITLKP